MSRLGRVLKVLAVVLVIGFFTTLFVSPKSFEAVNLVKIESADSGTNWARYFQVEPEQVQTSNIAPGCQHITISVAGGDKKWSSVSSQVVEGHVSCFRETQWEILLSVPLLALLVIYICWKKRREG